MYKKKINFFECKLSLISFRVLLKKLQVELSKVEEKFLCRV